MASIDASPVATASSSISSPARGSQRQRKRPNPNPDPRLWPLAAAFAPQPLRLRHAPLLVAALCFAGGELLAHTFHPTSILLLSVTALSALTLVALRRTPRLSLLPVAALWVATGSWCFQIRPVPNPQATLLSFADNLGRDASGTVLRVRPLPPRPDPQTADREGGWNPDADASTDPAAANPGALQVDLALDSIEFLTPDISRMTPIDGGVRITLISAKDPARPGTFLPLPTLGCGDTLFATSLRLRPPERFRDPGAWQYGDFLLAQGIAAHGSIAANRISVTAHHSGTLNCRLQAAQTWSSARLLALVRSRPNRLLPRVLRLAPDDGAMLNAMLFGDRTGLTHSLRLGFERTGSFHLFVVSGMHVALIAGGLFWLLRRARLPGLPRLPETAATLLTLLLTFGYALLTGFGAPVQRALWMSSIVLLARLLSRTRSILNGVGAAALAVLLWSPSALFESSFQMTFLAIVAIAGIAIPLSERSLLPWARAAANIRQTWRDARLPPRYAQLRVTLRLLGEPLAHLLGPRALTLPARLLAFLLHALELALIGIVAESLMVLPMAVYFHRATLFALPANMLSVPVVGLLVPAAVSTFACTLISPWLAIFPSAITAALLHAVTFLIGHFSHIAAADLRVPPPSPLVAAVALLAWAACCWAVRLPGRAGRFGALTTTLALPLVALLILWPEPSLTAPGSLEVTAIDVGQGDSLLVVGSTGRTLLVDAGGPTGSITEAATATATFDVGEEVVAPYLWSRRIRRLDAVALSHAHSDHMGGMPAILRDLRPRELWVSLDSNSDAFRDLLALARSLGVTVRHLRAGDSFPWGPQQIDVLAPEPAYANPGDPTNNDSLVLRLQYGQSSVLLEGDAEAASEQAMLGAGRVQPVTLLKVGHHGSRTSTTPEFLAAASPTDAIVSVGRGNRFGHPRPEVVNRLADARTRLYRTDQFGLTTFLLSRDGRIHEVLGASN